MAAKLAGDWGGYRWTGLPWLGLWRIHEFSCVNRDHPVCNIINLRSSQHCFQKAGFSRAKGQSAQACQPVIFEPSAPFKSCRASQLRGGVSEQTEQSRRLRSGLENWEGTRWKLLQPLAAMELYLDLHSQPCRSVFIFAKLAGIPFEFKHVDLIAGECWAPRTRSWRYNFMLGSSVHVCAIISALSYDKSNKADADSCLHSYFLWPFQNEFLASKLLLLWLCDGETRSKVAFWTVLSSMRSSWCTVAVVESQRYRAL